jgi:predicted dehydrogenase
MEELGFFNRVVLHTPDGQETAFAAPDGATPGFDSMKAWAAMIRDAVHSGITPPDAPTFEDGLACVEVMDRIASQAQVF